MSKRFVGIVCVSVLAFASAACGEAVQEMPPPAAPEPKESAPAAEPAPAAEALEFGTDSVGNPPGAGGEAGGKGGRLAKEAVQKSVRESFPKLRACYETGLKKDPKLAGQVLARFTIGTDGKVTNMDGAGSTLADKDVLKCVLDAMQALDFQKPEGGIVTVAYPIEFAPTDIPKPQALKEKVVGTWNFDFSGAPRAAAEAELKKKAGKDEKKLEKLMKEAEDEAAKSHFVFTADTVESRIGDKVLFKLKFAVVKEDPSTLVVKVVGKPEGTQKIAKDGEELVMFGEKGMMSFKDDNTLVMKDPKKGELVFKRK